jgi:hypothetical protein
LTPPPSSRVSVELYSSDHLSPRHVVHKNPRELLFLFLPLDLTAGDRRRRNTAALCPALFGSQPRGLGLEDLETQGVSCKAIDSGK